MMIDTKTADKSAAEWYRNLLGVKLNGIEWHHNVAIIEAILVQGRREGARVRDELLAACKVCVSAIDAYVKNHGMRVGAEGAGPYPAHSSIHMRFARHLAQQAIERHENGE